MNLALLTILLSMLLSSLGTSIINIAVPSLMSAFGASLPNVQMASLSYLISITAFSVVFGKLGVRYNMIRLFLYGLALFSLAGFAAASVTQLEVLLVLRFFQGIGAAALVAYSPVLLSRLAAPESLPFYMGLIGTMSAVGTALGPSLGGYLIDKFQWPALFYFMSGSGFFILVLFYLFAANKFKFKANAAPKSSGIKSVLKNKYIFSQLVINFLVSMVVVSTLVVGPFLLSLGLHLNLSRVGLVMSVSPLISIVSGIFSGQIVKLAGIKKSMNWGLFFIFTGIIGYAVLPEQIGIAGFVVSALVVSPGYQLFQASNNTSLMLSAAEHEKSIVSSFVSLTRNLGLLTGSFLTGKILVLASGTHELAKASAEQISAGASWSFVAAAATALLAFALAVKPELQKLFSRKASFKSVQKMI